MGSAQGTLSGLPSAKQRSYSPRQRLKFNLNVGSGGVFEAAVRRTSGAQTGATSKLQATGTLGECPRGPPRARPSEGRNLQEDEKHVVVCRERVRVLEDTALVTVRSHCEYV
jgi:hypothetical protein